MAYTGLSEEYLDFAAQTYARQLRMCTKLGQTGSMRFIFDCKKRKDISIFVTMVVPRVEFHLSTPKHTVVLEQTSHSSRFFVYWLRASLT